MLDSVAKQLCSRLGLEPPAFLGHKDGWMFYLIDGGMDVLHHNGWMNAYGCSIVYFSNIFKERMPVSELLLLDSFESGDASEADPVCCFWAPAGPR